MEMRRKSSASVTISPTLKCLKVYPSKGTKRDLDELKTIGITLSKDQAIHLARVLLAVTQDWDSIDLTVYRLKERADGCHQITITSLAI
jgi:hypothetical protein